MYTISRLWPNDVGGRGSGHGLPSSLSHLLYPFGLFFRAIDVPWPCHTARLTLGAKCRFLVFWAYLSQALSVGFGHDYLAKFKFCNTTGTYWCKEIKRTSSMPRMANQCNPIGYDNHPYSQRPSINGSRQQKYHKTDQVRNKGENTSTNGSRKMTLA
jgi:hypothetical protein